MIHSIRVFTFSNKLLMIFHKENVTDWKCHVFVCLLDAFCIFFFFSFWLCAIFFLISFAMHELIFSYLMGNELRLLTRQLLKLSLFNAPFKPIMIVAFKKFREFQTQSDLIELTMCVFFRSLTLICSALFPEVSIPLFGRMQKGILIKYAKRLVLLGN